MESAIEVLGGFVQNHGALTILIEVLLLLIIRSFVVNIPKKVCFLTITFQEDPQDGQNQ